MTNTARPAPRTFAIGDVHGCHVALTTLLGLIKPTAEDTIVFLGDVVDRGPATKECIDEILRLENQCRVISIMGNHEEMMRGSLQKSFMWQVWVECGGAVTLESYGGSLDNVPASHLKWLSTLRPFHETATDIFVHASLETQQTLANQTGDYLRWKKLGGSERPHISGKRVLCGHTPQRDGYPLVFPGWVCLDTNACRQGWLTCLDVEANHVWQTNESGQSRQFELADYA
jgi:serine/threonine protein phosphatase 1